MNYNFDYKTYIMIILELSFLTIISILQYTFLFIFQRTLAYSTDDDGPPDWITNRKRMWRKLRHQSRRHAFYFNQSDLFDDPAVFRNSSGMILGPWTSKTQTYFDDKSTSTLNRNWSRTLKTKVHKYNTVTKPRRIG